MNTELENKDLISNETKPMLGEVKLNFSNKSKPEEFKVVIIMYRYRNKTEYYPNYEIGSGYYHNGQWWVNFHNPMTFTETYEVLAWSEYDFA